MQARTWSQAAVKRWWRETKARYEVGERLCAEDLAVFLELLERHPYADEKRGAGVSHVEIGRPEEYPSQTSYKLVRVDGSWAGVGVTPIATRRAYTLEEQIDQACRLAVVPTSLATRDALREARGDTCEICGGPDTVVDHRPPLTFKALVRAWLDHVRALGAIVRESDLARHSGHGAGWADPFVSDSFRAYHDTHAALRLLCAGCNARTAVRS